MYKNFTKILRQPPGCQKKLLLVMKLTTIFLIIGIIHVSASGLAQKLNLRERQNTVSNVFKEIRKQTGYTVIWEPDKFDANNYIDSRFTDADLNAVMGRCLAGTNFIYTIEDKTIVISQKTLSPQDAALAKPVLVVIVKSEKDKVLPGATIFVKQLNKSAVTDANGAFIFDNLPEGKYDLEISFVGFQKYKTTVKLENKTVNLTVVLKQIATELNEMVIKGYYTTTNRLNTGNVATVKAADIERQPVADPILALEGMVPGLFIQQSSGLLGAPVSVNIRGASSISSGTIPLYIIDGVPFGGNPVDQQNPGAAQFATPNGGSDPLNLINPQDIESIEVLKDADATAIYGSRGANGVILITTKKGKAGKTRLNVNAYTGEGNITRMLPLLNTSEYLNIRRQAFANDGITPTIANAPDLLQWSQTQNTNYEKMLIGGTSNLTEINSNISGGDKLTTFLLSGTYHRETTVTPGDSHYERGSVNMKVDHTSENGKFKADLSTIYATDNNLLYGPDLTGTSITYPNNYPLYSNGDLYWGAGFSNPLALLNESYITNSNNLILNGTLSYNILSNLHIKANLGENNIELNEKVLYPPSAANPAYHAQGNAIFISNTTRTYIAEPQIDFEQVIAKGKLSATLGGTWQYQQFIQPYFIIGSNFPSEQLMQNESSAGTIFTNQSTSADYKYASAFGRLNYAWQDKYILNATFSRDGSSRFGPNKRYGNFGSVGAAWIFSDESAFKDLGWLSYGKLRGSYGTVGNDQIPNYGYLSTYGSGLFPYGSSPTFVPEGLANPNYSWERTNKLEGALELGFLNNRIMLNGAWFRNRTNNMLAEYPLSPQSGFSSYTANINAEVQSSGYEFELKATPVDAKGFKWNASFNISIYRNKLLSYPGLLESTNADNYIIGKPLDLVALYHFTGFKNGQATVADINNDGQISPGLAANGKGDYVDAGTRDPQFFGGFNNSIRYKSFQLDFLFNFVKQKKFEITSFPGLLNNQYHDVVTSGFTPSTQASSASYNSYINYYVFSDATFTDASFIRLKNVSLSYTLPGTWKKVLGMSNCTLYLRGQNVLTLTKYKGFDPETNIYPGVANNPYASALSTPTLPVLRTFIAGIQFSY